MLSPPPLSERKQVVGLSEPRQHSLFCSSLKLISFRPCLEPRPCEQREGSWPGSHQPSPTSFKAHSGSWAAPLFYESPVIVCHKLFPILSEKLYLLYSLGRDLIQGQLTRCCVEICHCAHIRQTPQVTFYFGRITGMSR